MLEKELDTLIETESVEVSINTKSTGRSSQSIKQINPEDDKFELYKPPEPPPKKKHELTEQERKM